MYASDSEEDVGDKNGAVEAVEEEEELHVDEDEDV